MKTLESRLEDYDSYMTLKNFSPNTKGMYLRTIRIFFEFRKTRKIRGRLKQEDARIFLLHRIENGRAWSTINCDYSALRKYFREVEELDWSLRKIPRPRKENVLPKILSKEDVVKLIEHAPTYKYQVFLTFMYTTGLRMSEALNLRMQDIDSDRLQIRIEKGKGSKDRYIQIPERLVEILRSYYKVYRPKEYLFNGLKERIQIPVPILIKWTISTSNQPRRMEIQRCQQLQDPNSMTVQTPSQIKQVMPSIIDPGLNHSSSSLKVPRSPNRPCKQEISSSLGVFRSINSLFC